jgi:hypothetical protein
MERARLLARMAHRRSGTRPPPLFFTLLFAGKTGL